MKSRIHIVTLGSQDVKRARKFYEKLGFKASGASQDDIVFLHAGGLTLALYPWKSLAHDAQVDSKGSGFRGVTLAHNVAKKKDVAVVLSQAEAAGAKILKPAQDVFWGGHSGYFADPDGHLWEVAWNPHFSFNKDGSLKLPK
jgi:catechol 2,3-dioxygenase-like lactoylglutathione lyase family enzyme